MEKTSQQVVHYSHGSVVLTRRAMSSCSCCALSVADAEGQDEGARPHAWSNPAAAAGRIFSKTALLKETQLGWTTTECIATAWVP